MDVTPIPLLIVEDNPVYAEILRHLLPTLGVDLQFTTKWVDTAEKAFQALAEDCYDLVLLDYKLPGADGLSVLSHIRSLPAAVQPAVVMLTGMGREEVAVQAMKEGAKDYLAKDSLDVPSLLRAISGALERKHAEEQVAKFAEELRTKNAQMQADLVMAREIQQAFLPHAYPSFPANVPAADSALNFFSHYDPSSEVGGDFFDVLRLSDTEAGVFICDVMGHGVRAALVTAMLRALVEETRYAAEDPSLFLAGLNRGLISILKRTRMPMFASACYLVVDTARAEVRYATAGHPAPLHISRVTSAVEPLGFGETHPGPALGVFEDSSFPSARRALTPRDLLLLYTDGLFEVDNPSDELFGQPRLVEAVRQRAQLAPPALIAGVLEEITKFMAGNLFRDDVCVVAVEINRTKELCKTPSDFSV